MKRNDIHALPQKSLTELEKMLATLKSELMTHRLEARVKQVKNTRHIRIIKDDIARILTMLALQRQKEQKV